MRFDETVIQGLPCIVLGNSVIEATICPAAGGKIVGLKLLDQDTELLWNNPNLSLNTYAPGTEYDPHFFGGIDELLPNDELEQFEGREYPDHGELWTTALSWEATPHGVKLFGTLSQTGFQYEKNITLEPDTGCIHMDYRIQNLRPEPNPYLLKMHAALRIHEGDQLLCDAQKGEIGDADFTGRHGDAFFPWPHYGADRLDMVQSAEAQRNEFFFLHNLNKGEMTMKSPSANTFFTYTFDTDVFPYAWYFASYGGWNGLYTGVLEPATAVPTKLSTSVANKTCTCLKANEQLKTRVTINVGRLK